LGPRVRVHAPWTRRLKRAGSGHSVQAQRAPITAELRDYDLV